MTLVVAGSAQLKNVDSLPPASSAFLGASTGIEAAAAADTAQPVVIFESEVLPGEPTIQTESVSAPETLQPTDEHPGSVPGVVSDSEIVDLPYSETVPAHWLGLSSVDDWSQY